MPRPSTYNSRYKAPISGHEALFASPHRFGFNGQERTDEIAGTGNHTTALYWEYDTRLGRRWNVDPEPQFSFSDYSVLLLNPIRNVDPLGNSSSPIFDSETGDYLGSDSEGFDKGDVLYMNKERFDKLSNNNKDVIDHDVAVKNSIYTNGTLPDNPQGMKLFEKSSYTIARAMYLRYEKEKPSLYNNTIEIRKIPFTETDHTIALYEGATPTAAGGWKDYQVVFNFNCRQDYLSTPMNIFSVFLHEYKAHGLLSLGNSEHGEIYFMQYKHPSYKWLTEKMQKHINQKLAEYGIKY